MIFKLPPQFGQCSMSMSKTRLSSLAQLVRAGAPCAGACSLEGSVAGPGGRSGNFAAHPSDCDLSILQRVSGDGLFQKKIPGDER